MQTDWLLHTQVFSLREEKLLVVFMSHSGEEALSTWGNIVYVDTTYNVIHNGLFLTLLMVREPHLCTGYVVSWMVHAAENANAYETFFRVC